MATGHWNPGYGNIVSKMRHLRANYPLTIGNKTLMEMGELNESEILLSEIKQRAKTAWSKRENITATSYQAHYEDKNPDVLEYAYTTPTEEARKNKPHPPLTFLTTRLHHVPGYHNADTTMGKPAYKVDESVPRSSQSSRAKLRRKYTSSVATPALRQYETQEELDAIDDPVERQAAKAWMKLAPEKEAELLRLELQNRKIEMDNINRQCQENGRPATRSKSAVPSLSRWLREAGAEERNHIQRIQRCYSSVGSRPPSSTRYHYPTDVVSRRQMDIENGRNIKPTSRRGDFLLHPDWPPVIRHHRLNGLSPIDYRIYPDKR